MFFIYLFYFVFDLQPYFSLMYMSVRISDTSNLTSPHVLSLRAAAKIGASSTPALARAVGHVVYRLVSYTQ